MTMPDFPNAPGVHPEAQRDLVMASHELKDRHMKRAAQNKRRRKVGRR
jgi:hypothetical protein